MDDDRKPGFPLEAFFAPSDATGSVNPNPEMRPLLNADIIIGRDVMSGGEFVVYGRTLLRQKAAGDTSDDYDILFIEIDQGKETDELEKLCAMVEVVKGRHEYEAG